MAKPAKHYERSFGISVGGVLCAVAAVLLWRGRVGRAEAIGAIGIALVLCGLVYPPILRRPSVLWWRFSRALGAINARILLTLLFFLALVPLSMFWRLVGKDPLARRRERGIGWVPNPVRYRDRKHYLRMY
jgi:saxitoxin biosynthesis operon SxtJ-like protein